VEVCSTLTGIMKWLYHSKHCLSYNECPESDSVVNTNTCSIAIISQPRTVVMLAVLMIGVKNYHDVWPIMTQGSTNHNGWPTMTLSSKKVGLKKGWGYVCQCWRRGYRSRLKRCMTEGLLASWVLPKLIYIDLLTEKADALGSMQCLNQNSV
jgi:hypothetical protein